MSQGKKKSDRTVRARWKDSRKKNQIPQTFKLTVVGRRTLDRHGHLKVRQNFVCQHVKRTTNLQEIPLRLCCLRTTIQQLKGIRSDQRTPFPTLGFPDVFGARCWSTSTDNEFRERICGVVAVPDRTRRPVESLPARLGPLPADTQVRALPQPRRGVGAQGPQTLLSLAWLYVRQVHADRRAAAGDGGAGRAAQATGAGGKWGARARAALRAQRAPADQRRVAAGHEGRRQRRWGKHGKRCQTIQSPTAVSIHQPQGRAQFNSSQISQSRWDFVLLFGALPQFPGVTSIDSIEYRRKFVLTFLWWARLRMTNGNHKTVICQTKNMAAQESFRNCQVPVFHNDYFQLLDQEEKTVLFSQFFVFQFLSTKCAVFDVFFPLDVTAIPVRTISRLCWPTLTNDT